MKCLLLLACLFVTAYGLPPEIVEKIRETIVSYAGECKPATGATDEDISMMKAREVPSTPTGKCFIACMHKKFGFQDADTGKLNKEAAFAMIQKMKAVDSALYGKMKKVADLCLGEITDAADECETAYNIAVCFTRENKNAGIEEIDF